MIIGVIKAFESEDINVDDVSNSVFEVIKILEEGNLLSKGEAQVYIKDIDKSIYIHNSIELIDPKIADVVSNLIKDLIKDNKSSKKPH